MQYIDLSKRFKQLTAVLVLCFTFAAFGLYITTHPEAIRQLRTLTPARLGLLLFLYSIFFLTLAWIQHTTLTLCNIKLQRRENILLVMYSTIVNFFGPLQSGPAFRGAYLKKFHNINLKQYTLATLLYYGFYAAFSASLLATYLLGPTALLVICLAAVAVLTAVRHFNFISNRLAGLELTAISWLALATFCQIAIVCLIFYVELNSFGHHVAAIPAMIYSGAANFALFVSLTPGAIGFRESFLVFSQHLHHIGNTQIITASLIDRSVYIVYLALLAILAGSLHAKQYLTRPSHSQVATAKSKATAVD